MTSGDFFMKRFGDAENPEDTKNARHHETTSSTAHRPPSSGAPDPGLKQKISSEILFELSSYVYPFKGP
jgi:hypothetical protein